MVDQMRGLQYPEDLVARVVAEYQEWPEICELARDGKLILGVFLAKGAARQMSPEDVIRAFDDGDPERVLEAAKAAMRRKKLHIDWMRAVMSGMSDVPAHETAAESERAAA